MYTEDPEKMMKRHAEKRAEAASVDALGRLRRLLDDTGAVMDAYEATHDDWELSTSSVYSMLVAAHFAAKDAVEKIEERLNGNNKPLK